MRAFDARAVQIGDQLGHGAPGQHVRVAGRAAVEREGGHLAQVAVSVVNQLRSHAGMLFL